MVFFKAPFAVLLGCLFCLHAQGGEAGDMLWLDSGERLRGEFLGLIPGQSVRWRHPQISEELTFPAREAIKIRLGQQRAPARQPRNLCLVRFTNRDEVEAELTGLNATEVLLETWYAGTLKVKRTLVDCIQPLPAQAKVVFEGPTGLEGWTLGSSVVPGVESNAWSYSQGALVALSSGSIARDLRVPNLATIEFDLAWNNFLQVAIALYADSLQPINLALKDEAPDFAGFYSLQLNANTVNMLAVKKGAPLNALGLGIVPGMENKTFAHITIKTHKPERAVYLYIDGVLAKEWRDPVETLGQGTCIRFVNQVPNPLKISNLTVSQWDGRLDLQSPGNQNANTDFVRLLNRDAVTGSLSGLNGGVLQLTTPTGLLEVPLDRVEQIHLNQQGRELGKVAGGEGQGYFQKRGRLLLKIDQWEKNRMVAISPNLGRIDLDTTALRLVELKNPPAEVR